jgi:class 3 adenylate cyclase/YHS domain-containing protein
VVEYGFLFADLSGYTALTEAHGDEQAATVAERFSVVASQALKGTTQLVKTIGDAVMLVASDPPDIVATALALVEVVTREEGFPAVRVGVHAGPAVVRAGDYFGASVNLAARVAGKAPPGELWCTGAVAALARQDGTVQLELMGSFELKNVAEPVALYRLVVAVDQSDVPVDPVCRMRLLAETPHQLQEAGVVVCFCSEECLRLYQNRHG